jgi:UDP-N-acetylmuramoyl-L-alanyl-D-glutamate--2,6-diaminopimelate ligase
MNFREIVPQSLRNYIHLFQSYWANVRYGFPSNSLKIIGVTGTDGKTTTSTMIYHILKNAGYKVGLISTVSAKIGKKEVETGLHVTTPDPWDVPKFLQMMKKADMEWVVMEVTSHGLDQNRIANITFEKAVYTNITHEHLDYHRTWLNLARAKAKMINMVLEGGEVIYKEDEKGGRFIERRINRAKNVLIPVKCNDSMAKKVKATREGLSFKYMIKGEEVEVNIPIIGLYNIANAQCAIKACEMLVNRDDIIKALSSFKTIKGRMDVVRRKKPCTVIVDFAHTPNALKKALTTVNEIKEEGRVIVVFGCAGLRDKRKRAMMGKIAGKIADVTVITAEDPRTEGLAKINDQIIKGANKSKGILIKRFQDRKTFRRLNIEKIKDNIEKVLKDKKKPVFAFDQESPKSREDAIEFALRIANSKDIVISTGKGHEKSLCFGTKEFEWSDFMAIKKALQRKYDKGKRKRTGKRKKRSKKR